MAGALAELGLRRGFVVHGSDGLDEITTTGSTLEEVERDYILRVFRESNGVVNTAHFDVPVQDLQ